MELQEPQSKRYTPLGIVALFVSLSEIIAGLVVGTSKCDSFVQLLLGWFVVLFPVFISSLFFYVLWNRPQNLYHPEEYGDGADVTTFTDAMRRRFDRISQYEETIESTVKRVLSEVEIEGDGILNTDEIAAEVIKKIEGSRFITIDTTPILGSAGRVFRVPYDEFESVGLFLLYIWHEVDVLPVSSYMKKWVILNGENGKPFKKIGSRYARRALKTERDERSMEDAGVTPGMLIKVERL